MNTYTVRLYMAGDIEDAKRWLRREVYPPNDGLCVTIEPTTFIYTGGQESGFVVGFVNYPRFSGAPETIFDRAVSIAERMVPALAQWSALVVATDRTEWIHQRPEGRS